MTNTHRALLTGLVFAALTIVVLSTGPEPQADAIDSAIRVADLNELTADSAPQQQVVNGWVARDLLEIQAKQIDGLNTSIRATNLLLVALVAAALFISAGSTRESSIPKAAGADDSGRPTRAPDSF